MFRQRREEKIVKAKINLVRGVVFLLILVLYTGNALATASFVTSAGTGSPGVIFGPSYTAGNLVVNHTGAVSTSDPLQVAGAYLSFSGANTYTFTPGAGNSLFSLSGGATSFTLTNGTATYLTGTATAFSLDISGGSTGTGTITWNPTSITSIDNSSISSTILSQFTTGAASLTTSFAMNTAITTYLASNTSGGSATSQLAGSFSQATAAPEPGEWALMLVGLGLIGFTIYRKQYQVALPEWQNVRRS